MIYLQAPVAPTCNLEQDAQYRQANCVCSPASSYETKSNPDRQMWQTQQPQHCMFCGKSPKWPPLAVHEIERRSHAPKRWANRCNYLLLCQECHSGPFATMPHAKQLAVKWIADRMNYDLEGWIRLRDPHLLAPKRVTQQEVDSSIEELSRRIQRREDPKGNASWIIEPSGPN